MSIASAFFKRLNYILDVEKIEADKKVLIELVSKYFPDWRRVLNECQRYSASGKIDSGILSCFTDIKVNDVIQNLKRKKFFLKYVNGSTIIWTMILLYFLHVYDAISETLDGPSIAAAVLIVAKYNYQSAFVADQEINLLAALTEIMVECNFK